MPIVGLSLATTREYQSMYDSAKGTPDATVFMLGTLDSRVMGVIRDKASSTIIHGRNTDDQRVETKLALSEVNADTVRFGVKGWRNLKDAEGNDLAFKTIRQMVGGKVYQVIPDDLLMLIPNQVIDELASEIRGDNEATEDEIKN
jgi:hypothetical protein